ncbi:MAG: N-acetylmuramoyl-L-alanine amidase [Planctomycetota bacterium]
METMAARPGRRLLARTVALAALVLVASVLLPLTAGAGSPVHETRAERLDGLPAAAEALAGGAGAVETAPVRTPMPFDTVGFDHPDGIDVEVRTSADGETWTRWFTAESIADDDVAPDAGEGGAAWRTMTEPVYVREAAWLQTRLPDGADPAELSVELLDSSGLSASWGARLEASVRAALGDGARAQAAGSRPAIVSRQAWGADESWRNGEPRYASEVRFGVLHHTAGTNAYGPGDGPALVRSHYAYHTRTLGWDDLGYNVLVDRYGTIYQGRAGGLERGVIGAHARGFNTGSFGVAVMGDFHLTAAPPAEALRAVEEVVAWKALLHGIDPEAVIDVVSGGSDSHPAGSVARIPTLVGHRDVGATACPGSELYPRLAEIRANVSDAVGDVNVRFLDVDYGGAHGADIDAIAEAGITEGCDLRRYCPEQPVTRREMASLISRTLSLPDGDGTAFTDVSETDAHRGAIYALADAGITVGCGEGRYCPRGEVSRAEMASFLSRALDLPDGEPGGFTDVWSGSTHAHDIDALAASGITRGCAPERFCPNASVTREQMASFLERARTMGY